MSDKRFDQARPVATLGIVAALWVLLPVAVKSLFRASFFEFTAPITSVASHVRDLQEYWSLRLHSSDDLIAAGRDLARVNASYQLAVQQNAESQAEIARLEHLLNMPALPGYRLEPARVAQRDFTSWWHRLVIRKGRNYGILVGAPVVFGGGAVGRVSEVHAYTSVVEVVGSPGFRLAANIEGDSRPVSFTGRSQPAFGPGQGLVEFVPMDVFIAGDTGPNGAGRRRLTSSGLGGVFPAGLTLGWIEKIEPSTDGLFQSGVVRLDPQLDELTEVTVLVPPQQPPLQ